MPTRSPAQLISSVSGQREPTEYAPIDDTFSPVLHRINQCIRHRAIHPDAPLPPVPEALTKYSHPPAALVEKSRRDLEKLVAACNVKKGASAALCLLFDILGGGGRGLTVSSEPQGSEPEAAAGTAQT